MRLALSTTRLTVCLLGILFAAPLASAQWDLAELEQVTSGPDFDMLARRAMGLDDRGTVHAIYQRGVGLEQGLYYVSRTLGGRWSEPEVVGAPGTYPGTGWLEVRGETGEPYVVFFQGSVLTLGIRRAGGWEFHSLATPAEYGVGKAAMTLDPAGFAHIAMLVDRDDPLMWQIAYGYWDGSDDFHFQVLERSIVPHHGLFAQPDIVARDDGSVVIAYHQDEEGQFLIMVEENDALGGTDWRAEAVDVRGVILYPESLEIDSRGDLHLAFHTNIELGAEHHVQYACRRGARFGNVEEVGGAYAGARPRIAIGPDDQPHLVFEEMLGPRATGRLIWARQIQGQWVQDVIVDGAAFTPSFVMDEAGNGSLLFERRIIIMEDNDVEYFGHVAPAP